MTETRTDAEFAFSYRVLRTSHTAAVATWQWVRRPRRHRAQG